MSEQSEIGFRYIQHQVQMRYDKLGETEKDRLVNTCNRYLNQIISYEEAKEEFLSISVDLWLLDKLRAILKIKEESDSDQENSKLNQTRAFPGFPDQSGRRKSKPWSDYEDTRLIAAVFKYGAKDWKLISNFVGIERTSSQCNQRWCRALDPNISHMPWADSEDQQLLKAVGVLGTKNWSQVSKIISHRTDLQCRYRYSQLMKYESERKKEIMKQTQISNNSSTNTLKTEEKATHSDEEENNDQSVCGSPSDKLKSLNMDLITAKRRNSITIAPFISSDIPKPLISQKVKIPYYLDIDMMPTRDNHQIPLLHRLPPLIFKRTTNQLI